MLSLSTAYNIAKHKSWQKLLAEVKKLGFSAVELNVQVPESWMPEIERSVAKGEITISSLHNYCPKLPSLPPGRSIFSGYNITSDDEEERRQAVAYSRKTIEWASRLNAPVVVLHAGEVATSPSGREFYRYVEQFGFKGKLYQHYESALLSDRAKNAPVYIDLLARGLDEVLRDAVERKVTLGLENRIYIHEIPRIEEVQKLLEIFSGAPLGYWHDTGHAEVFVRQGWVKQHADFLIPFASRIVGTHLHDLHSLSDHYAPGSGDLDFGTIAPYLRDVPVKVIEAHSKSNNKEVSKSIEYLKDKGIC